MNESALRRHGSRGMRAWGVGEAREGDSLIWIDPKAGELIRVGSGGGQLYQRDLPEQITRYQTESERAEEHRLAEDILEISATG